MGEHISLWIIALQYYYGEYNRFPVTQDFSTTIEISIATGLIQIANLHVCNGLILVKQHISQPLTHLYRNLFSPAKILWRICMSAYSLFTTTDETCHN